MIYVDEIAGRPRRVSSRKILALSVLAAGILSLSGCIRSYKQPHLDLVDAKLISPDGTTEFQTTVPYGYKETGAWNFTMSAHNEKQDVTLWLFSSPARLSVRPTDRESQLEYDLDGIYYEHERRGRMSLSGKIREYDQPEDSTALPATLMFNMPENMTVLIDTSHNSFKSGGHERFANTRGIVHRVYIPFEVDGETHAVDVSFKLRLETEYDFEIQTGGLP